MIKNRKERILISVLVALGIVCVIFGLFRWSAYRWDQSFVGKPVSELKDTLAKQGIILRSRKPDSFEIETGQRVKPDQEVFSFVKGTQQLPFLPMTIGDLRYVVVEKHGDRRILQIVRYRQIDSL